MRIFLILFFCIYSNYLFAEILVFKNCKSKNYEFEKNEYRLDIDQGLMTREFIYTDETYERLRFDDIRVKKENETMKKKGKFITHSWIVFLDSERIRASGTWGAS